MVRWRGGATFDVINPASEEVITKVASAGIEDAKKAINAAEIAFESWGKSFTERQVSNFTKSI